jgi:tetratricopeptide (TPR) repeat protein
MPTYRTSAHSVPDARLSPRVVAVLAFLPLVLVSAAAAQSSQTSHGTHGAHGAHAAATAVTPDGATVPLLGGLGTWHRRITTKVPLAQRYFDQGLRLYYAFNHAESARAFREAQRLDPGCAMCAWGEAMALGPNINAPMDSAAEERAIGATRRAQSLVQRAKVDDEARLLVQAIAARFLDESASTRAGRDSAYAKAMTRLAERWPNDIDVLALAAEAQMDLSPWMYWGKDGRARPGTPRILGWLERGLQLAPDHPGICHFYIHAVEAVHPRRAVRCAERLAALMPGAGHIVHMPAHIYIRVGRWADAIAINKHAVHADNSYFDGPHTPESAFYEAAYRSHNHHFLVLAAVMAGASGMALESAAEVTKVITTDLARAVPIVQPMLAVPVQTMVTFGRWDDVLRTPMPPSDLRVASAHFWYARGIAFAATARTAEARATIDSIRSVAAALPEGEPRMTLDIAALAVEGELARRTGDRARAIKTFNNAVALEDALSYMEPPTWYYPVRHSLGKALLAAGRASEAEQVYRLDLQRFPENGWSLKGLALSLAAQGKQGEAAKVERRFATAWRLADVTIPASRF